ncbi:MAG: mandelate racemase/muconate lactonizing enzyme family protein [Proteobacteria bacterium]|jgi:L-alanine-DL-glutamate epimerase-like enolase superfamily enzyme|nr:mandelate racemase/muconate lactonizing enzyme family protein [Actinomycetota bacterium]NBY46321.1 mandelate racemase/muconate lactonizing enzyme family protein [Pseudomonadota bacterium]
MAHGMERDDIQCRERTRTWVAGTSIRTCLHAVRRMHPPKRRGSSGRFAAWDFPEEGVGLVMKITKVTVAFSVAPPREREIRDALQLLDGGGLVEVRIEGSDGLSDVVTGTSSTGFGRLRSAPGILAKIIEDELAPAIIGQDPFLIRGIRDQLSSLTEYHGTAGIALMGIAAIDIALWDLVGHALNSPVWRLLGPVRNRIPAYAMVGWLNFSVEELKPIAEKAVAQGFRGVKMKVGAPTLEEDIERIEAVRSITGRDLRLMVDANQTFALPEAIRRGRVYQELGCYWFEEPLRADNHAHLAELASVLDIRIASGENDFGKRQFRDLFERRAVDVVQPDLRRAGGATECLEIAAMADAFDVEYASHGGGPHLHLLAAMPNALYMESGYLPDGATLDNGCIALPEGPGFSRPVWQH